MVEEPQEEDLYRYGSVCKIIKTLDMPDGTITAILQAFKRLEIDSVIAYNPYINARVHYLPDILREDNHSTDIKAIGEAVKDRAVQILRSSNMGTRETIGAVKAIDDFRFLVNFVATTIDVENFESKMHLLEYDDVKVRGLKLLSVLDMQIELMKIKQEINQKVKSEIDQQQREYYLNNQLRTIQEELGMDDAEEFDRFKEGPQRRSGQRRSRKSSRRSSRNWRSTTPRRPTTACSTTTLTSCCSCLGGGQQGQPRPQARPKGLDHDHYGLETVKERIIEYLAVLKLKGDMKSPILCLYGPPGVGKTSLGKSVAKSLGRKYVRIALGGMHDEAEIRGHRKTYVGALPGRILNGIARAGTSNPVIVLDEIDKLSSDFKGDPSSALLEALDPEQNKTFHDNYLDIDYDLSNVLFITTANSISPIQPALLDRMEVINVTGYLAEEKMEIARKFLVPKQMAEHGLEKDSLRIDKPRSR